ncbi:transposase [Cohnella cellulosilytica]|uniref:Transposase n=1 Tax=Cohnella cellulosilytica TaxID=986710 RepID=A0ABW2FFS1_9BACL
MLQQFATPERIIGIAIDMWEPYKLAIQAALPHVITVIDAFHLIQASSKALDGLLDGLNLRNITVYRTHPANTFGMTKDNYRYLVELMNEQDENP